MQTIVKKLLPLLFVFSTSCTMIDSHMKLADGREINVRAYSFYRTADAQYKNNDTEIHYGAQTEAAKLHGTLSALIPFLLSMFKAGAMANGVVMP